MFDSINNNCTCMRVACSLPYQSSTGRVGLCPKCTYEGWSVNKRMGIVPPIEGKFEKQYRIDTPSPSLLHHRDNYGNLTTGFYTIGELGVLEIEAQQVGAQGTAEKLRIVAETGEVQGEFGGETYKEAAQAILNLRRRSEARRVTAEYLDQDLAGARKLLDELDAVEQRNREINGELNQENKRLTRELKREKRAQDDLQAAAVQLLKERDEAREKINILIDQERLRGDDVLHGRARGAAQERQAERCENPSPIEWRSGPGNDTSGATPKQGTSVPQADGDPYLHEVAPLGSNQADWGWSGAWNNPKSVRFGFTDGAGQRTDAPRKPEGGDTTPAKFQLWELVKAEQAVYARENKWLNEAAEAAGCDLDQVANVIRKLKDMPEEFDWKSYSDLRKCESGADY